MIYSKQYAGAACLRSSQGGEGGEAGKVGGWREARAGQVGAGQGRAWFNDLDAPAVLGKHLKANGRAKDGKHCHEEDVQAQLPGIHHQVVHPALAQLHLQVLLDKLQQPFADTQAGSVSVGSAHG